MKKALLAAFAVLLVLPIVLVGGIASGVLGPAPGGWSAEALADIPPQLRALYERSAPGCPGLPPQYLAGIVKVESDHGRTPGPSVAGAVGPAQFLPATWATWATDGNGDGRADPLDPADAVPAAVRFLCALGAGDPAGQPAAAWKYNRGPAAPLPPTEQGLLGDDYVQGVLMWTARYTAAIVVADPAQAAALLANPRVQLTPAARADLAAGITDQRVVAILAALAARYPIAVSVLKSGHAKYVHGTSRVSNHWYGRAADIFAIGGQPVSPANPYAQDATAWLATVTGPLRPAEVGSPFGHFDAIPGWFSNAAHLDHLHVGYGTASP